MTEGFADQDDGFLSGGVRRQECNRKAERLTEGHVSLSCRDAGAGIRLMLSASRRSFRGRRRHDDGEALPAGAAGGAVEGCPCGDVYPSAR